jgi:hypothetical protein
VQHFTSRLIKTKYTFLLSTALHKLVRIFGFKKCFTRSRLSPDGLSVTTFHGPTMTGASLSISEVLTSAIFNFEASQPVSQPASQPASQPTNQPTKYLTN